MREKIETRTINQVIYIVKYKTTDLITEAFGKIFLDIDLSQMANSGYNFTSVTIKSEGLSFTRELHENKCMFDLSWMKYFTPKCGTYPMSVVVRINNLDILSINYELTAGRGEVALRKKKAKLIDDSEIFLDDYIIFGYYSSTKHFSDLEVLVKSLNVEILDIWDDSNIVDDVGIYSLKGQYYIYINGKEYEYQLNEFNDIFQNYTCSDIELRITDRNGLRGAIGGMIIADKTESKNAEKSNIPFTPISGVYQWRKSGAEVKFDVVFNCYGDSRMLNLLRDGCVYGQVEWYCEQVQEWLPCLIEDNSLDSSDAYAEQIVTIKLQSL